MAWRIRTLITIVLVALFIFLDSCKKDITHTQKVSVCGSILNFCTDSTQSGVKVFLTAKADGKTVVTASTTSQSDGSFIFYNIDSHSDFIYTLATEQKSGDGNGPEVGIIGSTVQLSATELTNYQNLYVIPSLYRLYMQVLPPNYITTPDSLSVTCEQNTYHENVPSAVYKVSKSTSSFQNGNLHAFFGNYPMGLWHITIDKWKAGIYTQTKDSLYLGWGDTKTYTINW